MEKEEDIKLTLEDMPKNFLIVKDSDGYKLKIGRSRPIIVNFPILLDKKLARVCAMILDGSISKDFASCMFYQKKDENKAKEFASIIKKIFKIEPKFPKRHFPFLVVFSNKSMAFFLNKVLNVHKSDQSARIPDWIWNSSKQVIIEYLRYAFAMEGSVMDPKKGAKEIRFHSCDILYVEDLRKLLKGKFDINSRIQKYFIKNYGLKYYLTITSKENITKFTKIGIALDSHQKRLNEIIKHYKPKAWETTLVTLFDMGGGNLSIKEIESKFRYLNCRRSVHERLCNLIKKGFLSHKRNSYTLTAEGKNKALFLKENIKVVPLRTNPIDNERKVLQFIATCKQAYRDQIARSLGISTRTVTEVLTRLAKKEKVKQIGKDRFGRKFWVIRAYSPITP